MTGKTAKISDGSMSLYTPHGFAIEIDRVSKNYGNVQALRSVSLRIEEGAFVAFMGSNGAGKTTLLKIIATHSSPSCGMVRIFGENVSSERSSIRNRIGFLSHESYLYDELTIRENLSFYARIFSVDEASIVRSIDIFDLRRWQNVPVRQLSYGLRKRADIARALLHTPDLILLDEPLSGLDGASCDQFLHYFLDLRDAHTTLIFSSHSPESARKLCESEVVLEKGKILHSAPNS